MNTINATDGIRILDSRRSATLLSQVLWITTAGFLITAGGAYIAPPNLGFGFLFVVLIGFGLLFGIRAAMRTSPGLALTLFYVFTFVMGIEIGPLLHQYMRLANGQTIVFEAAITTALGMAVMAMLAQIARFNYQKVGSYAIAALWGLILIGIIGAVFHFHLITPGIYAWGGLAIFSVLLLVDFMRLRDTPAGSSPVMLAVSIYLDALNIFLFLLQIFSGGSRSRS